MRIIKKRLLDLKTINLELIIEVNKVVESIVY